MEVAQVRPICRAGNGDTHVTYGYSLFDNFVSTLQTSNDDRRPTFKLTSDKQPWNPYVTWALIESDDVGTTFSVGETVILAEANASGSVISYENAETMIYEGMVDVDGDGTLESILVSQGSREYVLTNEVPYLTEKEPTDGYKPYSTEVTLRKVSVVADYPENPAPNPFGATEGDDTLRGTSGRDRIDGLGGDDIIMGRGGNDTLLGGLGRDQLAGGDGADTLKGGKGADSLDGGAGHDTLLGGNGSDTLSGGGGNDVLQGGRHGDLLNGGAGHDVLIGQRGNDILTGGRGADVFVFGSGDGDDTVTDFQIGIDLIRITSGADAFRDLRITSHGDDVRVSFDDVTILLQGVDADDLARSDFLFT